MFCVSTQRLASTSNGLAALKLHSPASVVPAKSSTKSNNRLPDTRYLQLVCVRETWAVLMSGGGHVTVLTVAWLQLGCGRQTMTRCERVNTCWLN